MVTVGIGAAVGANVAAAEERSEEAGPTQVQSNSTSDTGSESSTPSRKRRRAAWEVHVHEAYKQCCTLMREVGQAQHQVVANRTLGASAQTVGHCSDSVVALAKHRQELREHLTGLSEVVEVAVRSSKQHEEERAQQWDAFRTRLREQLHSLQEQLLGLFKQDVCEALERLRDEATSQAAGSESARMDVAEEETTLRLLPRRLRTTNRRRWQQQRLERRMMSGRQPVQANRTGSNLEQQEQTQWRLKKVVRPKGMLDRHYQYSCIFRSEDAAV